MWTEESISIVFSGIAIIISIIAVHYSNEIGRASIRADNCKEIFDEYLISKIPKSRSNLRFGPDGKLHNGNNLCEDLSSMLLSALFYKFDDQDFFTKLREKCEFVEDLVAEAADFARPSKDDQDSFFNELQCQLESIYGLIDKKRIGKKFNLIKSFRPQ